MKAIKVRITLEGLAKAGLLDSTVWYVSSKTAEPAKNVPDDPQLAIVCIKNMHGFPPINYHDSRVELHVPHATMLEMGKSGWTNGNPTPEQWAAFVESCAENGERHLQHGTRGLTALDCAEVSLDWGYEK